MKMNHDTDIMKVCIQTEKDAKNNEIIRHFNVFLHVDWYTFVNILTDIFLLIDVTMLRSGEDH